MLGERINLTLYKAMNSIGYQVIAFYKADV